MQIRQNGIQYRRIARSWEGKMSEVHLHHTTDAPLSRNLLSKPKKFPWRVNLSGEIGSLGQCEEKKVKQIFR